LTNSGQYTNISLCRIDGVLKPVMPEEKGREVMSEDIIKEIENRMKEIEATKADLWDKGQFDPMMEAEYWDCQIVVRQMKEGEGVDVSELQKKKQEGIVAAQQQMHKMAAE
jgi:hypothetical protein